MYHCEKCQLLGKQQESCSHMLRRFCSIRHLGPIKVINAPTSEKSVRQNFEEYVAVKRIIQKTDLIEFASIKKVINWSNMNALEYNKSLDKILAH